MTRAPARAFVRMLAKLMACVLLFAQLSVAAYACPGRAAMAQRAMADALMQTQSQAMPSADEAAAPMPDCQGMASALDPDAANLCAEHCKLGQQSHEVPAASVPGVMLGALYVLRFAAVEMPPPRQVATTMDALTAASPPLAVLHCIFRI